MKRLTLLTRADCHLCEQALAVLTAVAADHEVVIQEIDVDSDPELRGEYGDMVPVVLIDGIQHAYYTVDRRKLELALRS